MSDDPWVTAMLDNSGKEPLEEQVTYKRKDRGYYRGWRSRNRSKYNEYEREYRNELLRKYPFFAVLERVRAKARKEGVDFTLDYRDWVEVPTKCQRTGMKVVFGEIGPPKKNKLVFDRVNRAYGWTKANTVLVAYGTTEEYREKMLERKKKCSS